MSSEPTTCRVRPNDLRPGEIVTAVCRNGRSVTGRVRADPSFDDRTLVVQVELSHAEIDFCEVDR